MAYADFGTYSATFRSGGDYATAELDVSSISASAILTAPISEVVGVFGKVGIASWDQTVTYTSNIGLGGSESYSGTNPLFGIGISLNFDRTTVALQFEKHQDVGDKENTGEDDIDVIGVSASLSF